MSETETSLSSLAANRSEEHKSELQSPCNLVCRLLLDKKKNKKFPASADQPQAFALVQQGGSVQQAPTYQDGNPVADQASCPIAGGYFFFFLPNPNYSSTPSVIAPSSGAVA